MEGGNRDASSITAAASAVETSDNTNNTSSVTAALPIAREGGGIKFLKMTKKTTHFREKSIQQ